MIQGYYGEEPESETEHDSGMNVLVDKCFLIAGIIVTVVILIGVYLLFH